MKAKEIFNQQAINQTVGIGYDYNEAVGKLSINSPNRVSATERGIPHVLKGVDKPLFRKSIVEPLNETSIIIQKEMRTEDKLNNDAISNKSVPEVSVKVVSTTEIDLDTDKLEQKDNMHNMPKLDLSHKACDVSNCMSCAFNVMYVYFNSKHAFLKLIYLIKHVVLQIVFLMLSMSCMPILIVSMHLVIRLLHVNK